MTPQEIIGWVLLGLGALAFVMLAALAVWVVVNVLRRRGEYEYEDTDE